MTAGRAVSAESRIIGGPPLGIHAEAGEFAALGYGNECDRPPSPRQDKAAAVKLTLRVEGTGRMHDTPRNAFYAGQKSTCEPVRHPTRRS